MLRFFVFTTLFCIISAATEFNSSLPADSDNFKVLLAQQASKLQEGYLTKNLAEILDTYYAKNLNVTYCKGVGNFTTLKDSVKCLFDSLDSYRSVVKGFNENKSAIADVTIVHSFKLKCGETRVVEETITIGYVESCYKVIATKIGCADVIKPLAPITTNTTLTCKNSNLIAVNIAGVTLGK